MHIEALSLPVAPAPSRELRLVACSLCLSVLHSGRWLRAEAVIRGLRTFDRPEIINLDHAVCGECTGDIRARRDDR
jgi:hypothetical protein